MKTKGVVVTMDNGRKVGCPVYLFDDGIYECLGEMNKLAKKEKKTLHFVVKDEVYLGVWFS